MTAKSKSSETAGIAALAIVLATLASALTAAAARASISTAALTSASFAQSGVVGELTFGFRGAAPRWKLSAHGQELWIDLPHTRADVPPRPIFGREAAPLAAVRVVETADGGVRIVAQVDGKIDYAIAR